MEKVRILEIKQSVFANNDAQADLFRRELKEKGIYLLNLMSSPGSGKTTTLKRVIERLKDKLQIAVAYYESESNELLSLTAREVTDFSEFISEDFVISSSYDYAKIFLWGGELSDAKPLYTALKINK